MHQNKAATRVQRTVARQSVEKTAGVVNQIPGKAATLASVTPARCQASEFCRQAHAINETSRVFPVPQVVLHVLDISRQGEMIVDDKPVVGLGDL